MSESLIPKYLIIAGLVLIFAGLVYYFFGDKLQWLGNLPGDIKVEGENSRFYFPVVTMILISIILSVLLNVFRKFL